MEKMVMNYMQQYAILPLILLQLSTICYLFSSDVTAVAIFQTTFI